MKTLAQKIETAQANFDAATKALGVQTAIAACEQKKAEEKAVKDAKERESKAHLSDAAAIHLVVLRMKHDKHPVASPDALKLVPFLDLTFVRWCPGPVVKIAFHQKKINGRSPAGQPSGRNGSCTVAGARICVI